MRRERLSGNCYAASEAAYHLLGGKAAGWKPMRMDRYDGSHWFLRHSPTGLVVDLTARQFRRPPSKRAYSKAVGCGFLTRKPSRDAIGLMEALTWKHR